MLTLAVTCVLLAVAATATAGRHMFVGVDDDALKIRPQRAVATATDLGISAFRITLDWNLGQTQLGASDRALLQRAVAGRGSMRIVLAVYGRIAPIHDPDRQNYCTYVRNALNEFPQINDVVIWNEPNLSGFWSPQFNPDGTSAAPAAYEALLARCYDLLHVAHPQVNVIAPATSLWGNDTPAARENVSHSPVNFIRELGIAYRASGRARPLFDTFGHHPHPGNASERPWREHPGTQVSEGDLNKLVQVLRDEFFGTAQPVPGTGLSIWYLEDGYQTTVDPAKAALYWGLENWPHTIPAYAGGEPEWLRPPADSPAPDQYTQLIDAIRLAYCQPYVGAYFNFLLWDERSLRGWQSGVFWADGTAKASYSAFRQVIHEVNEGSVDCAQLKGGPVLSASSTATGGGAVGAGGAGSRSEHARLTAKGRTRLTYTGTRIGAYGFVRLRAVLTRASGKPLSGRTIVFKLPGVKVTARSNRRGVAVAHRRLPLARGGRYLRVRFVGDRVYRPAWARVFLSVVNSQAILQSKGVLRLPGGARTSFHIRCNRSRVRGTFRFRSRSVRLNAARITALGVDPTGSSAWFAGRTQRARQFIAYVRKRSGGGLEFQLWASGGRRNGHGRVVAGRVVIRVVT